MAINLLPRDKKKHRCTQMTIYWKQEDEEARGRTEDETAKKKEINTELNEMTPLPFLTGEFGLHHSPTDQFFLKLIVVMVI